MSIRLPLQTVFDYNNTTIQGGGPSSVAGGVAKQFSLPLDTDNIVVKLTASVLGGGVSATFQTSDDGGTTWYDVQRTSIVSNANGTNAEFLSPGTITGGFRAFASVVATGSIQTIVGAIGRTAASTLGVKEVSGLPIMGQVNRVFLQYTSGVSSIINERVTVYANQQSGGN